MRLRCVGKRINDACPDQSNTRWHRLIASILDKFADTTQGDPCHYGENCMTHQATAKLLTLVQQHRRIPLEELVTRLPELTWNQVFSQVDELSRRGVICLRRRGFEYELWACSLPA
jgi:hypothetical protein